MSPYPGALAVTIAALFAVCCLWGLAAFLAGAWCERRKYKVSMAALDAETDVIIRRGMRKLHAANILHLGGDEFIDTNTNERFELDRDGRLVKRAVCP